MFGTQQLCVSQHDIIHVFHACARLHVVLVVYTHRLPTHLPQLCSGIEQYVARAPETGEGKESGIPRSGRGCRCPILSTTCSSVRECVELSWAMRFAQYPRIHIRQVNIARGQTLRASPNPFRIFDRGWVGCFVSECVCVCVL